MPTGALTRAPRPRWVEPTSLLPLRWGLYRDRYLAGLTLIVGGAVQLQGSNTYTLTFLLIGTIAHIAGWSIMPARGSSRIAVIIPATAQIWLLLTGPLSVWMFTIQLACWLQVRRRPPRSYVALALPLANGLIMPNFLIEYSQMPTAIGISTIVLVGSAWLGRMIAASAPPSSQSPPIIR